MDNVRFLLYVALALVLYLMWQAWQHDYAKPPAVAAIQGQASTPQADSTAAALTPTSPQADVPVAAVPAATASDTPETASPFRRGQRIHVRTDLLDAEIDTAGGDLRQVDLIAYPISLQDRAPFRLFGDTRERTFIAQTGIIGNASAPNHHADFTATETEYLLANGADSLSVPLSWTSEEGVTVTKTYVFHRDSYVVDVHYRVDNPLDADWTGRLYGQFQRTPPSKSDQPRFIYTYTGAVLHSDDNRYEKIKFDEMVESPVKRTVTGGWAAMIQHYFGAAWLPDPQASNHYFTKAIDGSRYVLGVINPPVTVPAADSGELSLSLYVGPKEQERLKQAAPGLELTVDYGVLTILAEPVYWLMELIHDVVGNWGWSIIFVTVVIKLMFFHLSAASYKSMARMRAMQPRLATLKERYGDDRNKLNQAMMELYKKEKINPLGGCLPVVVQIPVFISLYWVLLESVELRQAPFMLWIQDLSTYDPYFVLPILMGATMLLQQRLNPAPMDPIQQKVMMALPLVFTVMFLFFPSGLVLYWFVNNSLSITQQWIITRRMERAAAK